MLPLDERFRSCIHGSSCPLSGEGTAFSGGAKGGGFRAIGRPRRAGFGPNAKR